MSESDKVTKRLSNQALQKARSLHGWTQQDIANYVGTTVVNVSRWERGITSPNPYFRRQLCILFKKDADALGLLPIKQVSQREISFSTKSISPSLSEKVQEASVSLTISWFQQRRFSPQRNTLLTIILVMIVALVTGGSLLVHAFLFSQPPQISYITAPQVAYTDPYENIQIDGWGSEGHFLHMQDNINVDGQTGVHTLQTIFSSRNSSDMPFIYVNTPRNHPLSGQTISGKLLVSDGTTTTVKALLFAVDSHYGWHMGNLVTLPNGKWNTQTFTIPSFPDPVAQVGVQFLSQPYNVQTMVYADAIQWQ